METYEIVGPDGRVYEVQAPSQEAAIEALEGFALSQGGVSVNPQEVEELEARIPVAARGFADVASFGLADELASRIRSISPNVTYDEALEQARAQIEADIANYPGARMAGQVAGGLTAGLALGGPLDDMIRAFTGLRGSSAAQRVGRGAIAGGLEGAAYGLGSGEGAADRLAGAAQEGLLGATVGGIVPATTQLANMAVLRPIGGALGIGNERRAANALLRTVEDAGAGADEIQDYLNRAAAEGQPQFTVADALALPGRRTLAGTTMQPGAARALAEGVLDPRQTSQTGRLAEFVEEALDARNTTAQAEAAARVERGAAADVNYGAARASAQPVDVRSVIGLIDERIGPMRDTTIEGESVDAILDRYRRRMAGTLNVEGADLPAQLSDLSRLGRLYSEMRDTIEAARRAGRNYEASQISDVRNALGEALENASPAWREANARFAAASRIVEAPTAGQAANVRTTRAADVADRFADIERQINAIRGLTDAQREQFIEEARQGFRIGYANRDLAGLEGASDYRNMARQMFMSDRQRANYDLLATDPELFERRVGREDVMSQTRNAAMLGSRTAENLADQEMVEGADISLFQSLLSPNPLAAVPQIAGRVLQAARGGNEATREMIARALLSNDTQALSRLLQTAQRGAGQSRMLEAGIRGGVRGLLAQDQ